MKKLFSNAASDAPASVVVFLVALPLCLGIALGSGAPLFSGIIAGMVGGIVVGMLSGSSLSVSGPAAGLTAVVAVAIGKMPAYEAFLLSVVIAGAIQVLLGFLRAGVIGDYVPNAVIRGMLAAIGVILILKQLPHLVGFDRDYDGDETFIQFDQQNTFTELIESVNAFTPLAVGIGLFSVLILLFWESKWMKKSIIPRLLPGPLAVVISGVVINMLFLGDGSKFALKTKHLVNLPVASDLSAFAGFFTLPKWEYFNLPVVWTTAVTLALIASLETLLAVEAVDKLDPFNRRTPTNRELKAQGVGNMLSGLIGGLPLTSVIVRSSANVNSGAKTKLSTIMHGMLLLLTVFFIPGVLNKIPLSALAAILIMTGYKLVKPSLFVYFYRKGWDQLVPFVVTLLAILMTDLLIGIMIGIGVALFSLLNSNFKSSVMMVNDDNRYLVRFRKDISFLNKPILKSRLESVPEGAFVLIDLTRADFIDRDIIDAINEFLKHAHLKNITVEVRKSLFKSLHQLVNAQPLRQETAA